MTALGLVGQAVRQRWTDFRLAAAVGVTVVWLMPRPAVWTRPVRRQVAKQILFTGVDALGLILLMAVLTGVSVVSQAQLWLGRLGQTDMLGPLLVAVVIRGAGPVLVNVVVIARSGTAIVTELATMRVHRQVRLLDAQGLDPMIFLVMTRVVGVVVSVLSLAIFFVAGSLFTGFLMGVLLGGGASDFGLFIESVMNPIRFADVFDFLGKCLIPALFTGVICCIQGLSVKGSITEVPQAATAAVVYSIAVLLLVSAVISLLTFAF